MPATIMLDEEISASLQREADERGCAPEEVLSRWVEIGRALERSEHYNHARVEAALRAEIETSDLTEVEAIVWMDLFTERMSRPSPEEAAVYARLRTLRPQL